MNESGFGTVVPRVVWYAARLNLSLGIVFAAIFTYFAFRARFTTPYIDDWWYLASVLDGPFTSALWQPHNEHIIPIPLLLVWLDYWFWGWPGYATLSAALLSDAVIAGVLISACRGRSRDEVLLLSGTVLMMTFLTYGLQGTVFVGTIVFPLVTAFSMLAIWCFAKCSASTNQQAISRWAGLSVVMSLIAMLCLTNGLVVPLILCGLSWLLGLPRRITITFLAVGVAGLFLRQALGSGAVPPTAFAASLTAGLRFGLAMLAGPVASLSPYLAVLVGACIGVLALRVLWRFSCARLRTPTETLLVGNLCFILASVAMTALGRAQFDLSVAAESRYAQLAAVGWVSLLLLLIPAGITTRPIGKLVAVLLPVTVLAALPIQVFIGRVWAAKADHLKVASLALAVGIENGEWVSRIRPLGTEQTEPILARLRARGVTFLSVPELGRQTNGSATSVRQCDGTLEAISLRARSSGIQVQGRVREAGHRMHIIDSESRVRGVATHSPAVQHAVATPNDFVWAELDTLTGRVTADTSWLGFAVWGSGPPFRVELLNVDGQLVCQVQITCCSEQRPPDSRRELVVRGSLPLGSLDAADCSIIGGWAWDSARPNESIDVRITTSDGHDMTVTASNFRQDLLDHGMGSGHHAFTIAAPRLSTGGMSREVSASIAATGLPLTGSPKTVVCQK